jgi:diaminohydroxyphosphoribosylaminopyrimidine deaminase/5-amino-6-(5-phosphoribosylamino)uracil reductase
MQLTPHDNTLLLRAIELAHHSVGLSEPNPRVGCVIHDASGQLAGEGWTQQAGGPHAEVMAMRQASTAGRPTAGGTAWVSLEPCAHHGRTPPCADALIAAGLCRVVVALTDPYAEVAGRGIARLRAAGLTVDVAEAGAVSQAAYELNIGFFSRVLRRRPWVRMKIAASLDGRTALSDGSSQWITGEAARADGQSWRRRASAILTGIGTVRDDDPRLNVRLAPVAQQPLRVVVDSGFNTPPLARLLRLPGRALVVGTQLDANRVAALKAAGAEVCVLPDHDGRVDLPNLLNWLAIEGVNELHVEAGATLNAALLQSGCVDELLVYLAPKLLGPGRDMAALPALVRLSQALDWQFEDIERIGSDIRLRLRLRRVDTDVLAG